MTSRARPGALVVAPLVVAAMMAAPGGVASAEPSAAAGALTLRFEPVAEGLEAPVLVTGAGDGSGARYVVEQRGLVLRLGLDGRLGDEPLLDISERVLHHNERGLLGLAFHPDFEGNGRFFVSYSRRDDGATSISEFTQAREPDPAKPVEASERPLLVIAQPYTTHKGGMLAFDQDGMLLISTGDGGSGNDPQVHAQDGWSLLGKLLRIDVDRGWPYAVPDDNGFIGQPGVREEVQAMGLRNPWRFSVDRASGAIYIGDVGQSGWEEIDVLPRGARAVSFGWADMEGPGCLSPGCDPDRHVAPAVAYRHVAGGSDCAVIGGYAYRGRAGSLPQGTYLYGDYCSGVIWAVGTDELVGGTAVPARVARLPKIFGQLRSFGEDDDGELYVVTGAGDVLAIGSAEASG